MDYDLTPELFDRIVFAMEDQSAEYAVDTQTGQIVKRRDLEHDERFVRLPDWRPVDGFQLMERFVGTLRNQLYRGRLREALITGSRVFRSFKNELQHSPFIEQLWYQFKEREMRHIVVQWYNSEREARGLSQLGPEPDDVEDLVASEFAFDEAGESELAQVAALYRNLHANRDGSAEIFPTPRSPTAPGALVMVACDGSGEVVGFAWAERGRDRTAHIGAIGVAPEVQGLGVGRSLLERLVDKCRSDGVQHVDVSLSEQELELSALFTNQDFEAVSQTFRLTL